MERYYLNKIKALESKLKRNTEGESCLLVYSTMPNNKIKANIEIGKNGFHEPVYFNSEEELKQYKQDKCITLSIDGIDIDKI